MQEKSLQNSNRLCMPGLPLQTLPIWLCSYDPPNQRDNTIMLMFSKNLKKESTINTEARPVHASAFQHRTLFAIVDGISTGKNIAPMLRGYGHDVIHIQSNAAKQLKIPYVPADFIECFEEGDSIDDLANILKGYPIKALIPGAEAGVKLADILNEQLGLPRRNDFSKTESRQSKYEMHEAIKTAGLPSANQIRTNNIETLTNWAVSNGYPIVLKPENSAGTDNVYFCHNRDDLHRYFDTIMSCNNIHGNMNLVVIAQEMLIGDEFMVNTISSGETICVSDIVEVKKKILNNSPVYDYSHIISPSHAQFEPIFDYVSKALKAVGFKFGAAHTEIIFTKDRGPVLVEVNARLIGASDMATTMAAVGRNQVSMLVKSLIKDDYVSKQALKRKPHPAHTMTAFFIAETEGTVVTTPDLSFMTKNPLVFSIKFGHGLGSMIKKTSSLMNSPGMINLVADTEEELMKAYEEFRKEEKTFFSKLFNK